MTSIDHLVFVMRQSPNWESLAKDYEAGIPIDAARYKPAEFIAGFPDNLESLINNWNNFFPVNFFRCRQTLKEIAVRQMHKVEQSVLLTLDELPTLSSKFGGEKFILFFLDDDDWFDPRTFEKLSAINFVNDVCVFPLVRFDANSFTFIREAEDARIVIGNRSNFHFRFQTNNYGLLYPLALSGQAHEMKDHVAASQYADKMGVSDSYFDLIISATNKTPASASALPQFSTPENFRAIIANYVNSLGGLAIPEEMEWVSQPINETLDLFNSLLD
ncbi:MAG: hypothetical protein NTV43_15405 [Methylococcales bacterium]|nr:hypothetical protein [Methylococcales bacterium]